MAKGTFGALLKELRVKKGMTLREFCMMYGFDAGNYSRVERGLFAPPNNEKVEEYAKSLDVAPGSDLYVDLFDRAAIDRGVLPQDLLADDEVLEQLPVLFRTLRGQAVEESNLDKLVDLLRKRSL